MHIPASMGILQESRWLVNIKEMFYYSDLIKDEDSMLSFSQCLITGASVKIIAII